jgi:hypothetical protein
MEEINGIFDDDGNKIDMSNVRIPLLCNICRKMDDIYEKPLCDLNRYDQRNEEDFKCGAFEKKD